MWPRFFLTGFELITRRSLRSARTSDRLITHPG
ncbi:hypothetical protein SFR_5567 [Streptomyces sp. FR-008]|nr:hypothetical protein SFR_5567 [Streptomyces sp. FR-008]